MKKAVEKKLARRVIPKKKLLKKKAAPNKKELKTKAGDKKTAGGKTAGPLKKQVRGKSQSVDTVAFALEEPGAQSGEQSEDLQDYPTSKVRIPKVWMSYLKKETRSRPTW
ncbi:MAG TPA: hypothetical protein VN875_17690 [Candidatus Binatus sp.]|jgi:hypothetical protein|nr:hypothetical protein [Candidatus Binatus sp.]